MAVQTRQAQTPFTTRGGSARKEGHRGLPLPIVFFVLAASGWCQAALGADASISQDPAYPDRPAAQQYAPEREADILHLALDVTPNFARRSVAGSATWSFRPLSRPLETLRLDAVHLDIRKVTSTATLAGWQTTDQQLVISFAAPVPIGQEASVSVEYAAEQPAKGLYFRVPSNGYLPPSDAHLFTQGEAEEARYWYPCYDAPNDKFTSEITCHTPRDMVVLSNGVLVSEAPDDPGGSTGGSALKSTHWRQDKPQSNYLVSLVAGHFDKLEDHHRDVPLAFYTLPSESAEAPNSFRDTRDIMAFYENEIGLPFPWAKYAQVCVADFPFGGMENTSLTTLADRTLFPAGDGNVHTSRSLVAHEMAHQWFGDLVTCKDWSQAWLNEGFATFYAHLYDEHRDGRDTLLYGLYKDARTILDKPADTRPTVTRQYEQPIGLFNFHIYGKGGWILHMLRDQLGVDFYRRSIKTYLERHAYGNVGTEDLRAAIEEVSGRSFDRFFDQWVYHGGQPVLDAQYSWDEKTRLAKITVTQKQAHTFDGGLFQMPLTLRFGSKSGSRTDQVVQVTRETEDFYVALAAAPESVRLDPDFTLLADIRMNLPAPMLNAQLANKDDMVGRLLALRQLAERTDDATIAKLKEVLRTDPFYGVRIHAAEALYQVHRPEALDALSDSREQPDSRARQAVFEALGKYYHPKACAALLESLAGEKNELLQASILTALGGYPQPDVQTALTGYLDSRSFRNRLVDAAFQGLKDQDDPASAGPVQNCLQRRARDLTSTGYAAGLEALAALSREQPGTREQTRFFLANQLNNPKLAIKLAAIGALGTLRDAAALPALRTFLDLGKDHQEQPAAEKATAEIRDNHAGGAELKSIRDEINALQKQNRELKEAFEQFKQQSAAGESTGGKLPVRKVVPVRRPVAKPSPAATNLP